MDHRTLFAPSHRLSRPEHLLLWAMRAWVVGIVEKIPVEEQIDEAFCRVGAPAATAQLYEFMWVLSRGAIRKIDVDCICKTEISPDERCLLDVLALTQHGRSFEALVLLRSLVEPKIALAAAETAGRIAMILELQGLRLPCPSLDTDRYVFASSADSAALKEAKPPSRRIH